ncbi:MAG TPA: hypothetical protein VGB45_10305 [Abditibacterium sp.]|jgi:hypothetical protein
MIEIKTQTCPRCKQETLAEAEMCWNCDTFLRDDIDLSPTESQTRHEDDLGVLHPLPPRNWRDQLPGIGMWVLAAGLVSSGWWRGKTRFGVLGAGLGIWAGVVALEKRAETRKKSAPQPHHHYAAIRCLADLILLEALRDGASQIRLVQLHSSPLRVEYLVDEQWRDGRQIPHRVFARLETEFALRGGPSYRQTETGVFEIPTPGMPDEKPSRFELQASREPERAEITLHRL